MLSTPSVKAAAALAKYAYTPTAVRPGFKVHAVVAVMAVLPALVALPALSVKFTALAERLSVSDSVKVAFKAIVCAPELSCADAIETANVIASPTIATRKSRPVLIVPPKEILCCPLRLALRKNPVHASELVTGTIVRENLDRAYGTLVTRASRFGTGLKTELAHAPFPIDPRYMHATVNKAT